MMSDLVAIQRVSYGGNKYADELTQYFTDLRLTDEQIKKRRNPRLFNVEHKEQADAAAHILYATFRQKAKLEGLGN